MIFQKNEWFAWPPPLLRTAVRAASGTALKSAIKSSMGLLDRSAWPSSALFRFVMYA